MVKKIVILIDNEQKNLELLEGIVYAIHPGAQCISFIYGDEAIEALCNHFNEVPDYIFVNASLKRTSGTRCISALRRNSRFNDCFISVFSAVMPVALAEIYTSMGADFAFQRPMSHIDGELVMRQIFERPKQTS